MLFRRLLHTFPEAPELAARNIIHRTPIVDPRVPARASFQVMGLGSVLQVQLPSSVELMAKRNSLIGVLGARSGSASLTSRLQLAKSPIASLLGRQPILQQTIVGASPLTCLIGSENKHMNTVELDGTVDWIVKSPIQAYTGKQLHISSKYGWAVRTSAPFSHTLVSGRGLIAWATPASPVQITLGEGESVVVQKKHLSAFTIDTNSTHRSAELTKMDFKFSAPSVSDIDGDAISQDGTASAWQKYQNIALKFFKRVRSQISWLTQVGNTGAFVEIFGPSTVLVSSAAKPPRAPLSETMKNVTTQKKNVV